MTTTAPHLLGNFAPVPDELTVTELRVTGSIPPELTGWYLRNGPNPREAASQHWFLGDGMVHGVRLEGGTAVSYRNRWVQTATLTRGARARDEQGNLDLTAGVANTHVVRHAGRTLALVESSYPYELNCQPGHELETIGAHDFNGRLRTPMTAHPKTCPRTGELHFFGYGGPTAPYLTYHRADMSGELTVSRPIDVPALTMMHDFQLTSGHVVFMDLPVVFDRSKAMAGVGLPYTWAPDYGARLGVLRRTDPYGAVRWFDIEPCYVFHALGGHEEAAGQRLVLHVIRYDTLGDGVDVNGHGSLWRWTIDLSAGTVREEQLDDRRAEFPRIDDRLTGLPCRHGHASTGHGPDGGAIHRYDLRDGTVTSHVFGQGRTPGEAAFAPADDTAGGPGWLMAYVHDAATDRSDLVILDADDLAGPPVATIHLPRRVPAGFHGNWLPDDAASYAAGAERATTERPHSRAGLSGADRLHFLARRAEQPGMWPVHQRPA
ncbi:carotenoid oxygenase family protein [Streptantibioticus ferralitis]|uniref:Dioxygenase n=1 Tax=Streptantibioticus ferralitis TaxID=236510 RepID=A0ABT5YYQ4_9ACTN|nr:carotenoid oxygenase family protein [Streptantibioticus ferralitis]MDF2256705.1 carotenoid oxygenase family protein [Streptantibioticus ferralitis]